MGHSQDSDQGSENKAYLPAPSDFPSVVEDTLSNLPRFPKLERLSVEFPFGDEAITNGFYHAEAPEEPAQIEEREQRAGWRALMRNTYAAISSNGPGVVKGLSLRNIVAKESMAWITPGWRGFLGGLERFELSLRGGENGAGWCMSTNEGYQDFVGALGRLFFNHLGGATHLTGCFTDEGPAGINEIRLTALPFHAGQMPRLQHISLSYVFICPPFLTLLNSHAETLRSVRLEKCFAIYGPDSSMS
ncbi:hypothetical protein BU26DRAFT_551121 [Trematosphaeria pertusa]|uniref:Uncharacterized protein n=1 Tax=Trematosphaeria pertusa TaxID=390896 RepID=A0A6A6IGN8_9PLEO|nr:uncharacterized protein BU26DRAFT_551121 [Trematosphaeria pertusa]KAF2249369.1 hypothetical protein BU26DRAFT_551121 [Trematosphaeria pertusa]